MTRFALTVVHQAATEGRVRVGGTKYQQRLLAHLGTYLKMVEFTEAVLLELKENDFMSSPMYEGVGFDAYGVSISPDLQTRFDIEGLETWYVKFTLEETAGGGRVLMASLHEPDGPLVRTGGTLQVRFSRR